MSPWQPEFTITARTTRHYLTENIYHRARIFDSNRLKLKFTEALDDLREELGFRIFVWVLMPEHCHLLVWPGELADPLQIMIRGT